MVGSEVVAIVVVLERDLDCEVGLVVGDKINYEVGIDYASGVRFRSTFSCSYHSSAMYFWHFFCSLVLLLHAFLGFLVDYKRVRHSCLASGRDLSIASPMPPPRPFCI